MKNWTWIPVAIVIIILIAGIFWTRGSGKKETASSPLPVSALEQNMGESTSSSMKKIYDKSPNVLPADQIDGKKVRIKTAKGDIVFEFFTEAPIAASNFIFLLNEGFYDGLTFHRREEGFVIQGGDPSGDGTGGPGYKFDDEPVTRDYNRGIVAMANSGPNTNGSQFFIMLADAPTLPKNYTIFGQVVEGIEAVDKIRVGDVMEKVTIE